MSDTNEKTVTLTINDQRKNFLVDDITVRLRDGGARVSRGYQTMEEVQESPAVAVAALNAALNPPGPGDVTVRQIKEALKPLQPAVSSVVTVEIFSDGDASIRDIHDKRLASGHDILATLASLMPKPAPDPRDELRECLHDTIEYMKGIQAMRVQDDDTTNKLITRAEKLKGKP